MSEHLFSYFRVNLEEMNPLLQLNQMDSGYNGTDPNTYTDKLIDDAAFGNGLSRYKCIYIYSGKFDESVLFVI